MADDTSDDVYNDPANTPAQPDEPVNGATELPADQVAEPSQSIFTPEAPATDDTSALADAPASTDAPVPADDGRGTIPELEPSADIQPAAGAPVEDPDANKLADVTPPEASDDTQV